MKVRVNGHLVEPRSDEGQRLLHQARGEQERPHCPCKTDHPDGGIPLYIALINDKCYVKRMPNTGDEHDAQCEFYEVSPVLSGRGRFENSAIQHDVSQDTTTVRLDFPLVGRGGDFKAAREAEDAATTKTPSASRVTRRQPDGLSLLAYLHLLYDDAHLNRFWPKMRGKRFYAVVARELDKAALPTRTHRSTMRDLVLVPRYLPGQDTDANDLAAGAFMDRLTPRGGSFFRGVVIGELDATLLEYKQPRFRLKHMSETLRVDQKLFEKLCRQHPQLDDWQSDKDKHLIMIFLVRREMDHLMIDQAAAMPVDENWIPFARSGLESTVIRKLNREERGYELVLDYDGAPEDIRATAILLDTPEPTPIFVIREMLASESEAPDAELAYSRYAQRFEAIKDNEFPNAILIRADDIPALPPVKRRKYQEAS